MAQLATYQQGGKRMISASAINTYLDCPLKFYFSVLEGLQEEKEVSETIESDVFGSILHKVMEMLYKPLCGKLVTADLLKIIRQDKITLSATINQAFAEVFFKTDTVRPLTGQNYLIGEMIRKYVEKIIERDSKLTPFYYLESERKIKKTITLTDKREIQLKGIIDRVDKVGNTIRIIDYKSGSGTTLFSTIENLFNKEEKERSKAVMQVFLYAWMYGVTSTENTLQPGIYYMRSLFSHTFNPGIFQRTEKRGKNEQVLDFADYYTEFEAGLRNCLDEIFGKETPFVQTKNTKNCSYCPFKTICGR